MKKSRHIIGLSMLLLFVWACSPEPSGQQAPAAQQDSAASAVSPTPSAAATTRTSGPRDSLFSLLQAYYRGLEASRLEEEKFFAPIVEHFYSRENLPREQVASIIRNGFAEIESRQVSLDEESLELSRAGDRFVLEFKGTLDIKRKGQEMQTETFHNRFVFNSDYQIVAYGPALDEKAVAAAAAPEQQAQEPLQELLAYLRSGDMAEADQFIHPEHGLYYLTRSGAYIAVYQVKSFQQVVAYSEWMAKVLGSMECELRLEAVPEHDCESFSKQGCFLAEARGYEQLTQIMQALQDAEVGTYSDEKMAAARDAQQLVQLQLVQTDQSLAMYFGKIEGQWYLLVLDRAQYDCSA
jgi:hypothetical protein